MVSLNVVQVVVMRNTNSTSLSDKEDNFADWDLLYEIQTDLLIYNIVSTWVLFLNAIDN